MLNLIRTKTFWAGVALGAYGVVQIVQGNVDEGSKAILEGFGLIFLRQGIAKAISKS